MNTFLILSNLILLLLEKGTAPYASMPYIVQIYTVFCQVVATFSAPVSLVAVHVFNLAHI